MLGLRNLAMWTQLPLDVLLELPDPVLAELAHRVRVRDPAVVVERSRT